jgi:glycosyltransferase involved in cell wall biosynthesis
VDQFLAIAPKSRQIDQPLVVGAYGRLCPQKGFDVLIEAMKHLNHNQVRLQIGGTGPDEAALKHQAQGCDTIQFLGRIDDVPQFLSQCDVIVIPSRWEPWGNVCLEARAAATPVIVTAVDGLPEQVQAFGQVIPAGNAVALARTLADFTQMPAQTLSQFGEQGRLSAQGAWDTYLDQWQSLLEKVV